MMFRKPAPTAAPVSVLLVLMVAMGPISTDLYLPALPAIQAAFSADVAGVQLTLSIYLGTFAICQILFGPLSDRFGRRSVMMGGMAIYFAASLVCVFAPSLEILILGRFLQALGACAGPVIARAIVRDIHGPEAAGRALARIAAAMGIAPLIGPVLGGYLTAQFGWQSCFVLTSIAGGMVLVGGFLLMSETNPYLDATATAPRQLMRNIGGLLRDRRFVGYTLAGTASYCGLFCFISGSSFVFIGILGVPAEVFGFCFSAAVVGFIAGAQIAGHMSNRQRALTIGTLFNGVFGVALLIPVLAGIETVWTILVPMVLYLIGMGLVLPHAQAGAVGDFGRIAGTASSLFGTVQYAIAAVVGVVVGLFLDGSALPMALGIALSGIAAIVAHFGLTRA
ncbi:multidrug effflux MFS transporter [Rhodospirillaceae bacterium KN72]|uniref:Bcr/CflA family efflux transporter n=1 Tax=Pacificispira spongiicola TaxID=2729598 RepID=A0A7Y0E267_9PROT|nr:multidrug effflux MFS transporter [Pacificispira spongiicola]NMM45091.1 multidrug effflux MFS transporter [Pacificispira spongiicola]